MSSKQSLTSLLEAHPIVDKSQSKLRWVILTLGCLMMVGSYYCFDIPAALKTQIDDYMGDEDDYELKFGLLYTLYAAPNVILPFFGGYLVDRFGVGMCLLLFSSLIAIGQVIFSVGLSIKSWPVIFIGRLVFGFGGESFTVANSALLANWFKGKELAFAFGINLSISKLGSVINNIVSPALASSVGIIFAMWFGAMLCGFGVLCVLITIPIDRSMDNLIKENAQYRKIAIADHESEKIAGENPLHAGNTNRSKSHTSDEEDTEYVPSFRDVLQLKHIFWILVVSCVVVYGCVLPFNNISSSLLLERDYFRLPPDSCQLLDPLQCQSDTNIPVNCPSASIYQPPIPSNFTSSDVDCTDSYWSDTCTVEYCNRLTDAETEASVVMSIPYIISAALSPPVGFLIDMFGYRAFIAMIAPAILIVVHMYLGLTKVNAIGPLVGQGLAYTGFVSVLWPAIPLVVEEEMTGVAFGIVTSMQNLACAVIPLIVADIYTKSGDAYIPNVEFLFVGFASVGVVVGIYMNIYDYHHGGVLNSPFVPENAKEKELKNPLLNDDEDVVVFAEERDRFDPNVPTTKDSNHPDDTRTTSRDFERTSSSDHLHQRHNRHSRNGSFSTYEEITRAGVFRTSGQHIQQ